MMYSPKSKQYVAYNTTTLSAIIRHDSQTLHSRDSKNSETLRSRSNKEVRAAIILLVRQT